MKQYNIDETNFLNSSGDFVYIHKVSKVYINGTTIRVTDKETHRWFFKDEEEDFEDIIVVGASFVCE